MKILYHFNQFDQSHITGPNFGQNLPPGHQSQGLQSDGLSECLPHLGMACWCTPQVGWDTRPCHSHWALWLNLPAKMHMSWVTPLVELVGMVQYGYLWEVVVVDDWALTDEVGYRECMTSACWAKWFIWVWRWQLEWEQATVRCRWLRLLFVVWLAVGSGAWGFKASRAHPLYGCLYCRTVALWTAHSIWVCLSLCLLV